MKSDMNTAKVSTRIEDDAMQASQQGVNQTPTFVLIRPPANPQILAVQSLKPLDFAAALSAALGT